MEEAFLEVSGLRKGYGQGDARVEVLGGIDLAIGRGELCDLLGSLVRASPRSSTSWAGSSARAPARSFRRVPLSLALEAQE